MIDLDLLLGLNLIKDNVLNYVMDHQNITICPLQNSIGYLAKEKSIRLS